GGRPAEFRFVKSRLREAPAGLSSAGTGGCERSKETAIVAADCNQIFPPGRLGQLARLGKGRRNGLFDKEMLAGVQALQAMDKMLEGAGEYVNHVDIGARQLRIGISTCLQKSEFALCGGGALAPDIANARQLQGAAVAQSRQDRQMHVRGSRARADHQGAQWCGFSSHSTIRYRSNRRDNARAVCLRGYAGGA